MMANVNEYLQLWHKCSVLTMCCPFCNSKATQVRSITDRKVFPPPHSLLVFVQPIKWGVLLAVSAMPVQHRVEYSPQLLAAPLCCPSFCYFTFSLETMCLGTAHFNFPVANVRQYNMIYSEEKAIPDYYSVWSVPKPLSWDLQKASNENA